MKKLAGFLKDRGTVLDVFRLKRKSPDIVSDLLSRASKLAHGCETGLFVSHVEIVATLVRRVTVTQEQVTIEIDRNCLIERLLDREADQNSKNESRRPILIDVPVRFRRRGVESKLVVLDEQHPASEPDANLVKALARAHEWWDKIVRGGAKGIGDIACAERLDRAYVTRMVCLAFLAPGITRAILAGRQPTELTAKRLVSLALKVPLLWVHQSMYVSSRSSR